MITNREEVLENALRVFAKMNYEKASLVTIAKACGLSKWGLIYYYPFKQDLFVAVVDKYIFATQDPANKFSFRGGTLLEFIDHHVESVEKTARRREQPAGMQLQLLLLPPADASAAVLPRCRGEIRRPVRERPEVVARHH